MIYEYEYPLAYNTPPWSPPLGALGEPALPTPNPACVAWVSANYNLVEYERLRTQELPRLLVKARQLAGVSSNLNQALAASDFGKAWSKFGRWHRSTGGNKARIDEIYGNWLEAVTEWFTAAGELVQKMALALNLPTDWLIVRRGEVSWAKDGYTAFLPPEAARPNQPIQPDSLGVSGGGSLSPSQFMRLLKQQWQTRPVVLTHAPFSIRLNRYAAIRGGGTVGSTEKLLSIWKGGKFSSHPRPSALTAALSNESRFDTGYPQGRTVAPGSPAPTWELVPPAFYVPGSAYGDNVVPGPREVLYFGHQELQWIAGQPGQRVLEAAFKAWGSVLVGWADSGQNPLKQEGKQKLRVAGASIKLAGAAIAGVGTVAANPIVAGVGAIVALVGELFASVVPVTVRCGVPGHKYHKQLGGFCGPQEPFLVRPPAGCSAGDILAATRGQLGGGSLWDKVLGFLTHPVTLGVGLLALAGGGLYLATRKWKTKNVRRKKSASPSSTTDRQVWYLDSEGRWFLYQHGRTDHYIIDPVELSMSMFEVGWRPQNDPTSPLTSPRDRARDLIRASRRSGIVWLRTRAKNRRRRNGPAKLRPGQKWQRGSGEAWKACSLCAAGIGPFSSVAAAEAHEDICRRCSESELATTGTFPAVRRKNVSAKRARQLRPGARVWVQGTSNILGGKRHYPLGDPEPATVVGPVSGPMRHGAGPRILRVIEDRFLRSDGTYDSKNVTFTHPTSVTVMGTRASSWRGGASYPAEMEGPAASWEKYGIDTTWLRKRGLRGVR